MKYPGPTLLKTKLKRRVCPISNHCIFLVICKCPKRMKCFWGNYLRSLKIIGLVSKNIQNCRKVTQSLDWKYWSKNWIVLSHCGKIKSCKRKFIKNTRYFVRNTKTSKVHLSQDKMKLRNLHKISKRLTKMLSCCTWWIDIQLTSQVNCTSQSKCWVVTWTARQHTQGIRQAAHIRNKC